MGLSFNQNEVCDEANELNYLKYPSAFDMRDAWYIRTLDSK